MAKKLNLGYGWELNVIGDNPTFEHSGFEPGYKCYSIALPSEDTYVVVMQNTEVGSPSSVAIQAAAIVTGMPYPDASDVAVLTSDQLNSFVGTYQLDGERERIIELFDGKLFYRALGGIKRNAHVLNRNTLFFDNGYAQLIFDNENDAGFQQIKYKNRNLTINGCENII